MSDAAGNPLRAGLAMLAAALLAMIWANSPWSGAYTALLNHPAPLLLGPLQLNKTLALWVNDALMAVFFLLVGIEIKREIRGGSLATLRQALLPAAGACGGLLVPALLFALLNHGDDQALRGWAIPCATDIAFSLVVLRLVAPRAPASLFAFLVALAVIDDLGAILIIAMFYTEALSTTMLTVAALPFAALLLLNRAGIRRPWPYLLAGALLWLCVLKSGVHATVAGVVIGLTLPVSTGARVEHACKPWVDYAVLPLFAIFNAGVALGGGLMILAQPLALGVISGLLVGKLLGITGGVWLAHRLARAALPAGSSWRDMLGVAAVAGIGFTMSLFVAALAFEVRAPALFEGVKLAVLCGSLLAAALAAAIFRFGRAGDGPRAPLHSSAGTRLQSSKHG